MIDVLRAGLDLREAIRDLDTKLRAYGYDDDDFPELTMLDKLERELFAKVNELDKQILG